MPREVLSPRTEGAWRAYRRAKRAAASLPTGTLLHEPFFAHRVTKSWQKGFPQAFSIGKLHHVTDTTSGESEGGCRWLGTTCRQVGGV